MFDFVDDLLGFLQDFVVWILNLLIEIIAWVVGAILWLLPDSPFVFERVSWGPFAYLIGYIFPIETLALHFVSILSIITLYYGISFILRIVRLVK